MVRRRHAQPSSWPRCSGCASSTPIMDSEFKKALETLALSHDTQKKAVSIRFAGEGKRRVKVGYVVENPIWKTSYRLVLAKDKKDQRRRRSRTCRAGRWSRTRPTRTGRTCAWR